MFTPQSAKPNLAKRDVLNTTVAPSVEGSTQVTIANSALVQKLSQDDMLLVRQYRQELAPRTTKTLMSYCDTVHDVGNKAADALIAHTKMGDLDFVSGKMADILNQTRSINLDHLKGNKSRIPLLGGIIDRIRDKKTQVAVQFTHVSDYIATTLAEVDKVVADIVTRGNVLEDMRIANSEEQRQLRLRVIGAKLHQEEFTAETDAFAKTITVDSDPFDVAQLAEAKHYLQNLSLIISNLDMLGTAAAQTAPQISLIQHNDNMLVDKFGMLKRFTIPAWKKRFTLAVAIVTQKKAADLANMIDDANNQIARDTASALKQTSIEIARSNQRGVYDLDTLEFCQSEVISTAEELVKIAADGMKDRQVAADRMAKMNVQLIKLH